MAEEPDPDPGSSTSETAGGPGGATGTTNTGTGGVSVPAPSAGPAQAVWVGIAALVVYVAFVAVLFWLADTKDETLWTRRVYLFSGIESIALAAAGYFFGREVHRVRAESAERREQVQTNRADAAAKQAEVAVTEKNKAQTKVKVLSSNINILADVAEQQGMAPVGGAGVAPPGMDVSPAAPVPPELLRRIAEQADRDFPDT